MVGGGGGREEGGGREGEGRVGQGGEWGEHAYSGPGVARRVEIRGRCGEPIGQKRGLGIGGGEAGGHRDQRRHREVSEGGGVVGGAGARAGGY